MSLSVGGVLLDGIDQIRNDNADALDNAIKEKKRARSATPRVRKEPPSNLEPAAPQAPKELRVPAKIAKKITKNDQARANKGNPGYIKKMTIIQRYMDNPLIKSVLHQHVPHAVLQHTPKTEEEADAKLQEFKAALNSKRMDSKIDGLLGLAGSAVEWATDEGKLINMDLSGYAGALLADKDDVALELEEFKCEYGSYLAAPWWMRLGGYFLMKAKQVDTANTKFLATMAPDNNTNKQSTTTTTTTTSAKK